VAAVAVAAAPAMAVPVIIVAAFMLAETALPA